MPMAATPLVVRISEERKNHYKQAAAARGLSLTTAVFLALDKFFETTPPAAPVAEIQPELLTQDEQTWFAAMPNLSEFSIRIAAAMAKRIPRYQPFDAKYHKKTICGETGANRQNYRNVLMHAIKNERLIRVGEQYKANLPTP